MLLPASVIGGIIGLVAIQLIQRYAPDATFLANATFLADATTGWSKLPGFLINIVFATLFLGAVIPPIKKVWHIAGPQLAYGQVVAWGQYAVGLGVTLLILTRLFDLPPMFGAIIPVGFEGGHGTAAGLAPVFAEKGWAAGADLAMASATAWRSSTGPRGEDTAGRQKRTPVQRSETASSQRPSASPRDC